MPFNFVDLFAGIGGFHIAAARQGGRCVAACEIHPGAQAIYAVNYGLTPHSDIRTLAPIPDLDLVCAGFPCQPHSMLGERRGLRDRRGQLFNALRDFILASAPRAFLLENVKGILTTTDLDKLLAPFRKAGYQISWAVLDSKNFGLPQHRERVYIVGAAATGTVAPFDFTRLTHPARPRPLHPIREFLDPAMTPEAAEALRTDIFLGIPIWDPPHLTAAGFLLRAQRSNYTNRKLFSTNGILGTIPTNSPPPIYDESRGIARHLSGTELLRCQGFPARFKFPAEYASRSKIVHYVGNAVSPPVISAIIGEMRRQGLV